MDDLIRMEKKEPIVFETYRLVLHHVMTDTDGHSHNIEAPIVLVYSVDRLHDGYVVNSPILINEMMDRLKIRLLDMLAKEK